MAGHTHLRLPAEEPGDFAAKSARAVFLAIVAAAAGLAIAIVLGLIAGDFLRRFLFAYLTALGFFLALTLGALFFVLIHHVTRAGWSVNVRRVAENLTALLPVLGVLFIPVLISVLLQRGDLYRWALPLSAATSEEKAEAKHPAPAAHLAGAPEAPHENAGQGEGAEQAVDPTELDPGPGKRTLDPLTLKKRAWLEPYFFTARIVGYFLIWSAIALYFRRHSLQQDVDGDYHHSVVMQRWSALCLIILALTLTLAAWDLFMSLDPHWYSTMFGVCYFAGGVISFFAAMIVILIVMQRAGYLREAVSVEHFHDLGKYLFAFTFFWGYVTFSQYMLLWYASLPEEVGWPARRGMTTAKQFAYNFGYTWHAVALIVLFCSLLIPFAGLLSRHVKRNPKTLLFWAVWQLVFQAVNIFWIVMPEVRGGFRWGFVPIVAATLLGVGGVLAAAWIRITRSAKLRPVNDPRVFESAAFVNV